MFGRRKSDIPEDLSGVEDLPEAPLNVRLVTAAGEVFPMELAYMYRCAEGHDHWACVSVALQPGLSKIEADAIPPNSMISIAAPPVGFVTIEAGDVMGGE